MLRDVQWGSLHTHSKYSAKDALDSVELMVRTAKRNGYGAIGKTDHGSAAGNHELYQFAKAEGIVPVPGIEMYIAFDRKEKRPVTWHMGVLANTTKGWDNLIGLANLSHKQFKFKPIVDLNDLIGLGARGMLEGLWATTGCWFGIAISPFHALPTGDLEVQWQTSLNMVALLQKCFDGRVLVELQHHRIQDSEHDDGNVIAVMEDIARLRSAPTLITTDSHYASVNSIGDHNMLKQLSSWSADPDDAVFPGDGYWLTNEQFVRERFDDKQWDRAKQGFDMVMGGYSLKVPDLDKFSLKVPALRGIKKSPEEVLRTRVMFVLENIEHRREELEEHALNELDVIIQFGFASYILLTAEVTDYCRANGIRTITRGSASGSVVCYLLGITQVYPLPNDLVKRPLEFDRFISRDRAKPPDIDLDIPHNRRQEVLDYMAEHYAVTHIGTWRELSESEDPDEDKGSLWVKYFMYRRKVGGGPTAEQVRGEIASLASHKPYDGIGVHAAGILIAQDHSIIERIPLQWIPSSKKMVAAIDKDMVEALGYVKLDVLGLRTLSALEEMETTTEVGQQSIPMDSKGVYKMLRKGRTAGVFQLSGYAQKKGMERLQPREFYDIVIALALFRPAVMQSGAMEDYLSRRDGAGRALHHRIIEKSVHDTHGVILFQEQVLNILRDLGMGPTDINTVLKAVKASNASIGDAAKKMEEVRLQVVPLAVAAGLSDLDIEWLEGAMQAYSAYGFNLSHAVSYAHMSYRTAWFKQNYPLEYWSAMLNAYSGTPKEDDFKKAMLREGHILLPAHVNKSSTEYTVDERLDAVRKPLTSILGVGIKASAAIKDTAPYFSMEDFARRAQGRAITGIKDLRMGHSPLACGGVVEALHHANAFAGLPATEEERKKG